MLVVLALEAAPLFGNTTFGRNYARLVVIICAVVLVNVFSCSGTAWAIWLVGFLIFAEVIRRIRMGPDRPAAIADSIQSNGIRSSQST